MKPTSEILERIEKCSSEHKDGVFTRLYRYLLREDIYYAAYQKLYANKGATTQGIDDDTADGFSDFYVKELIQSLKDGTYKANPVRREYLNRSDESTFQRKMENSALWVSRLSVTNSCKKLSE